jgi:serine/threonine protein kinase
MRTLTFNRVLGTGAMGTVYHAELRADRGFSRSCAVKVMRATSPDQEHFRARMRDEARLLGMLQDEHILGVSELVRIEGRDCVVMEYVEGVDLAELVRVRNVPPRALAELGAEVAGTLHRAHTAKHPSTGDFLQVVHRDVKPANLMITSRGGVRLLDFGVARAAFASRESQTQGLVLGTLNYFPPEVLSGGEPTPAVDIFGLGLTLWECATAREWGAPQVHKQRFERRVEQRFAELGEDYVAVVPILRPSLQWEPTDRPDGGVAERAFLLAADDCAGEGLRTWAREVVPPILAQRDGLGVRDDLVGRTIPIDGSDEPDSPPTAPGRSVDTLTYNDLAPPAAVARRSKEPDAPGPRPNLERPADTPPPAERRPPVRRRTRRSGLARNAALLLGAVGVGAAVGLAVLAFLVIALVALQAGGVIHLG